MFQMAVGHSDAIDSEDALGTVLEQCNRALDGATPSAGLLFCNYDSDAAPVLDGILAAYPDIELVGTSSVGEMSSILGFQDDSVTLALFASDTVDITAGVGTGVGEDPVGAAHRAVDDARAKTAKEPRLCLSLPSVAGGDPSMLLGELRRLLGEDIPILGGGSGPRITGAQLARQFAGNRVLEDAHTILLFSGPLSFSFGLDTGWHPVGRVGTVSEVDGSTIRTIDGEPALAFYERYLGAGAKPSPANPLAVFEPGSDAFLLRVPIDVDEETGSMLVAGDVAPGALIQLTVAVTGDIFDGTRSAVQKAIKGFPAAANPTAALVFSCAIRKLVLGTRTGTELDITREELGQSLPIAGLYCYGEIAPAASGDTRFHNETFVAVLLGAA
jgi:hypothetical protein